MLILTSCEFSQLNNPYAESEEGISTLYSSFSERPKHLDPAVAYSANEYTFIAQIYEPPLQYHYLKRPYQLEPLTAINMPVISYFNKNNEKLTADYLDSEVAYTDYLIEIKAGIKYQSHPAFDPNNHQLNSLKLADINTIQDFSSIATRELQAIDYVYQIKRLAHPKIQSPIREIMRNYIFGFDEFSKKMANHDKLAIKDLSISGVKVLSRYQYKIRIKGKYPQFMYWLAMPFFAAMPWEADVFYSQKGLIDKNITLDWFPIGTGPYYLEENNPNRRMILAKNPNYHKDTYPINGEPEDKEQGLLEDAGKLLPFIDKVIYTLEKETIPYWNKFLQGYYDASGISSDSFDQAVQFSGAGNAQLTTLMKQKGIQLQTSVTTSIFYMGFNMLDPLVGGDSERARKLRQAISIALDYEEYISIFMNGRGVAAQGILPLGIFGHQEKKEGINPYIYDWINGKYQRKAIAKAKELMTEAGYPQGVDPKTNKALMLYFDTTSISIDDRSRMNWYRKQFAKLGINLIIRGTDYNRFQEKMRNGSEQLFFWGWNADYPDPENFFFLLYSANGKVKQGGENAANYHNTEFDHLFEQMRNIDNNEKRLEIVQKMQEIIRHDAPWVFGFYPKSFSLFHSWYKNLKPNLMANNRLKYTRIDDKLRREKREQWNKAIFWPLFLVIFLITILIILARGSRLKTQDSRLKTQDSRLKTQDSRLKTKD
ncbi:MAG: ABC transporter substrate-binding protein [Methylococcales symbiont of Iophon sp. n. MRB-2018]|nr:MAG: ABC transporter substrate-binding protein [Methylococcales symbiont of Iophon sp. n. MRB-2018]